MLGVEPSCKLSPISPFTVSKDRLDVCLLPGGDLFVVSRNAAGLAELTERLKGLSVRVIAIEATGGFETVVAASLASSGLPVAVVNPAQIRHFAQALSKRAKTDPIDAFVIARFAEATKSDVRPLDDEPRSFCLRSSLGGGKSLI